MFSMGLDTVISIFSPTDALFLSDSGLGCSLKQASKNLKRCSVCLFLPLAISGDHTNKLVSPKDHIMVAGYPEATELVTPLFVVCLQSVCFFVSLNGTDHESQAIKWNYCVGVQSLQATENKNVILYQYCCM